MDVLQKAQAPPKPALSFSVQSVNPHLKKQEENENFSEKQLNKPKKHLETIEEMWDFLTLREKKNIIRDLIEKIVLTPSDVSIHYRFDFDK